MRVLLDCDDVLADFCGSIRDRCKPELDLGTVSEWDMFKYFRREERDYAFKTLEDPAFCRAMPLVADSQRAVARLDSFGFDIYCVTTPFKKCREWENARRDWIEEYFPGLFRDVIFCDDKFLIRGDFFVDDKPQNLVKWRNENPQGQFWLYDARKRLSLSWPMDRIGSWQNGLDDLIIKEAMK